MHQNYTPQKNKPNQNRKTGVVKYNPHGMVFSPFLNKLIALYKVYKIKYRIEVDFRFKTLLAIGILVGMLVTSLYLNFTNSTPSVNDAGTEFAIVSDSADAENFELASNIEPKNQYTLFQSVIWQLKAREGLYLYPYKCPAGYWTIGWGHVLIGKADWDRYGGGKSQSQANAYWIKLHGSTTSKNAQLKSFFAGPTITSVTANELLYDDFDRFYKQAEKYTTPGDKPRTYALALLGYNVKGGVSRILASDQTGAAIKARQYDKVAELVKLWNTGGGKPLGGLAKKREFESYLWSADTSTVLSLAPTYQKAVIAMEAAARTR